MNDEPKFFYDAIDVKHEKTISFWKGFVVASFCSFVAAFLGLAFYLH